MVDKFLTEDLNDLITDVESEKIQLPNWLNIVDKNDNQVIEKLNTKSNVNDLMDSITSQLNENLYNSNLSATSENVFGNRDTADVFMKQEGGNYSSNSKVVSSEDINNLIAMLTSDKNDADGIDSVTSATNTIQLEENIKKALNSISETSNANNSIVGGAKKRSKKASKKSSKKSSKKLSKKKSKKSSHKKGINPAKIRAAQSGRAAVTVYRGGADELEGGAKKKSKKSSKKASKKSSKKKSKKSSKGCGSASHKGCDQCGSDVAHGGAKKSSKKKSKKASKKKSSKKSSKKAKKVSKKYKDMHADPMTVGAPSTPEPAKPAKPEKKAVNPALAAFAKLSKHVAEALSIPNGPNAKRLAGAANRKIKEANPGMSPVEVAEEAQKYFDENKDEFKKMLEKM